MEPLPKIVQRGLQATQKAGNHPDPDLLTAFAEKSLNDRERAPVLHHLAECAECREIVSLAMPLFEPAPGPSLERSPLLNWPSLRWGALAACVVVVSAAVTLRYEHRQAPESVVAEKAPTAPAGLTAESESPERAAQEVAKNAEPAILSPRERDMAAAGNLDKQREKIVDHAMEGKRAVSEPKGFAGYQSKKVQDLGSNQGANAGVMKSADELPRPAAAPLVAAAPSSSPPAKTTQAEPQTEAETNARNSQLDSAARTMQTVTAAPVAQISEPEAKDKLSKEETQKTAQAAGAGPPPGTMQDDRNANMVSAETVEVTSGKSSRIARADNKPTVRWTLSSDGELQRSFDSGKTWRVVPVASHITFRALAANGSDVWIGGAAGALYHSSDAGQHWIQVKAVAAGKALSDDILTIEFSDSRHGKVTTSSGETWNTGDAGYTWQIP